MAGKKAQGGKPKKKNREQPKKQQSLKPQKTARLANEAIELSRAGDPAKALPLLRAAAERDSKQPGIQFNLGIVCNLLGLHDEARMALRNTLRLNPGAGAQVAKLGQEQATYGRLLAARTCYSVLVDAAPGTAEPLCLRGNINLELGDDAAAESDFKDAVAADRTCFAAWYGLARMRQLESGVLGFLTEAQRPTQQKPSRHAAYALGWHYHHAGDPEKALTFFESANQIGIPQMHISPQQAVTDLAGHCSVLQKLFHSGFFEERKHWGRADIRPVFVIGMPFAGLNSLGRSLAAAAPEAAHWAGESPWFNQRIFILLQQCANDFGKAVQALDEKMALDLANAYLRSNQRGDRVVIDTNPYNFLNLWMIRLLFPNALIVDCVRNREENLLACYFTDVPTQPFTANLATTVGYYEGCRGVIDFWTKILPGGMHSYLYGNPLDQLMEQAGLARAERTGLVPASMIAEAGTLAGQTSGYIASIPAAATGADLGINLDFSAPSAGAMNLNFGGATPAAGDGLKLNFGESPASAPEKPDSDSSLTKIKLEF